MEIVEGDGVAGEVKITSVRSVDIGADREKPMFKILRNSYGWDWKNV